jgi:hypothetical protein
MSVNGLTCSSSTISISLALCKNDGIAGFTSLTIVGASASFDES